MKVLTSRNVQSEDICHGVGRLGM